MTREEWALQFDRCMIKGIGCLKIGSETHEIARGPHRKRALTEPSTWIKTCQWCHSNKLDSMPIARQLAYKLLNDVENYDRQKVNIIRGRQPDAVDEHEVAVEVVNIVKGLVT